MIHASTSRRSDPSRVLTTKGQRRIVSSWCLSVLVLNHMRSSGRGGRFSRTLHGGGPAMPYAEGRVVHDADSHVVETPDWFEPHADPHIRARMDRVYVNAVKPGEFGFIDVIRTRRLDPADRATAEQEIMVRKNWSAMGSFVKEDRPRALDLLGFSSQLVFNTFFNKYLVDVEHRRDAELTYGVARAHNRAMVEFCSVDKRLLPVGYVPLADFERARAMAVEAIALGCKALMIPSACPPGHSPSHIELFPVWAA